MRDIEPLAKELVTEMLSSERFWSLVDSEVWKELESAEVMLDLIDDGKIWLCWGDNGAVVTKELDIHFECHIPDVPNQVKIIDALVARLADIRAQLVTPGRPAHTLIETASGWSAKADASYT